MMGVDQHILWAKYTPEDNLSVLLVILDTSPPSKDQY